MISRALRWRARFVEMLGFGEDQLAELERRRRTIEELHGRVRELEHDLELAQDDLRAVQVGAVPVAELRGLAETWRVYAGDLMCEGESEEAVGWGEAASGLETLIAKHAPAEDEQEPSVEPVHHPLRIGDRVVVRWDSGDYEGAVVSIDERNVGAMYELSYERMEPVKRRSWTNRDSIVRVLGKAEDEQREVG